MQSREAVEEAMGELLYFHFQLLQKTEIKPSLVHFPLPAMYECLFSYALAASQRGRVWVAVPPIPNITARIRQVQSLFLAEKCTPSWLAHQSLAVLDVHTAAGPDQPLTDKQQNYVNNAPIQRDKRCECGNVPPNPDCWEVCSSTQ